LAVIASGAIQNKQSSLFSTKTDMTSAESTQYGQMMSRWREQEREKESGSEGESSEGDSDEDDDDDDDDDGKDDDGSDDENEYNKARGESDDSSSDDGDGPMF
jgi:hypothetical protein